MCAIVSWNSFVIVVSRIHYSMLHGSSSLACALAVLFRDEVDRLYEDWKTSKAQNTLMDEIQEEDGAKQQPQKHLVLHDAVTVSSAETLADTVTAGKKKKKKTKNKNKSATAGTLSDKLAAAIGAGHTTPQGSPAKAEGVNDAVTASGSSPIKFPPGFEMLEDDQSMSETVLGDFESAVDANDLRENDGGGRLDGALRGGVQLQRPDPIEEERPTRSSSASIAESMASTPSTMSPTNKANAAKTEQWKQQQLLQLQNSKISSTLQKTSTVQTEEQVASLAHLRTVESRVAVLEEENLALKREMQTLTAQLPLVLDKLQQSETDRAALQDFCAQDRVLIDELRAQVEMLHKTVGAVQLRLQQQQADASPEPRRNVVNMPPGFARSPFGRGGLPPIGSELQRQDAHPITPGFSLFDGAVFPARRGLVPPSSGAGIIGGGLPAGGSGVASGDGSK